MQCYTQLSWLSELEVEFSFGAFTLPHPSVAFLSFMAFQVV